MGQNGLFQFSMEHALEIIIIFNDSGSIVYANQTAKQQLEYEEDLCQRKITDIFPGEAKGKEDIQGLLHETDGEMYNMMAYRGNRTCFPARVRFLTYHGADEEFWQNQNAYETLSKNKESYIEQDKGEYREQTFYICTAYNVSNENFLEKKANQAGQEAEEAQKVKTEFVANVTHELRTPVNGILGNTMELIKRETQKDKLELLSLVERGCHDMNAIINNILDFSKLEAGKFTLEPRKFHFRDMMNYVKGNHSNRIIEKGLDFSVTISPEIPEYVIGDELRLVQILNNLISNAYKFTSVGGIHVEAVKTAQSGNRVELFFMVIDTGIGIAKAEQDKLFKSFSQVDASISRKYGGTGLGLNICKQLIELMGGNAHVESDLGKGAIFSFDVWMEIPKEECEGNGQGNTIPSAEESLIQKKQMLSESRVNESIWKYGEQENKEEFEKKMSKLILSVEMENWEKAEMFAETVKRLLEEAPREVKSAALRLKMSVQKGDYEKAVAAYETLQTLV